MSYIGMELDALNECPSIGFACGLDAAKVCHGLMQMWAYVFRTEEEVLDGTRIRGFMYGSADAAQALVSFGMLERLESDRYRVRGADRLIGIRKARRAGGQAAKKNLVPGAIHKKRAAEALADGPAEEQPMVQPMNSFGWASALTPTTDNRLPTTTQLLASAAQSATPPVEPPTVSRMDRRKRERPEKPPPDPRHTPLKEALMREYRSRYGSEYGFAARDARAVALLLARSRDIDEHVRRYRNSLDKGKAGLGLFESTWNDLAKGGGPPRDIRKGITRAEDFDHSKQEAGADGLIRIQI